MIGADEAARVITAVVDQDAEWLSLQITDITGGDPQRLTELVAACAALAAQAYARLSPGVDVAGALREVLSQPS